MTGRRIGLWLTALFVMAVVVFGIWLTRASSQSDDPAVANVPAPTAAMLADPALISRGQYLVTAGDCAGCHTASGGPPLAGGAPLSTPFGNIVAPNLTPDQATGLGNWRFEDFWRALHSGKGRNGELLYPVFSYSSYTKVTHQDALAMFAYLHSLPAEHNPPAPSGLNFPYNQRATLLVWRALYFQAGIYRADPTKSAQWNRGAYLVQGLGHCVECHAARDAFGGIKNAQALSGGLIPAQNWYAPDLSTKVNGGLRGWSAQDMVALLKTGQSPRGVAFGPMADVVHTSAQHLTDDDLQAIATYLQSLPAPSMPMPRKSTFDSAALLEQGASIYSERCAGCHGKHGEGVAGVYPPLDGNSSVNEPTGINATRVVLLGGFAPTTQSNARPYSMPPYAQELSDADVAAVVTYIRQSWSNHAAPVQQRDVSAYRHTPID